MNRLHIRFIELAVRKAVAALPGYRRNSAKKRWHDDAMSALKNPILSCRIGGGIVLALAAFSALAAAPAESDALAVKAGYLTRFGIYIEWPDQRSADSQLSLCIVGSDPFGKTLEAAMENPPPGNRPVIVRHITEVARDSDCHIVYFGGESNAADTIARLRGTPILTVSDSRGQGAIINFVQHEDRVRFEIDEAAAAENNLVLSSKLLGLALNVKPRPTP